MNFMVAGVRGTPEINMKLVLNRAWVIGAAKNDRPALSRMGAWSPLRRATKIEKNLMPTTAAYNQKQFKKFEGSLRALQFNSS